jgi:hypothetical protein
VEGEDLVAVGGAERPGRQEVGGVPLDRDLGRDVGQAAAVPGHVDVEVTIDAHVVAVVAGEAAGVEDQVAQRGAGKDADQRTVVARIWSGHAKRPQARPRPHII